MHGIDPVQLAADAIELAQGGALNEASVASLLGESVVEREREGPNVFDLEWDGECDCSHDLHCCPS